MSFFNRQVTGAGVLLLLLLFATAGALSPRAAAVARAPQAQPALLAQAAAAPEAQLQVIVQQRPGATLTPAIEALGGTVTGELAIINALVVTVPGAAVPDLARMDGVHWLSLDAPTVQSGRGGKGSGDGGGCTACIDPGALENAYNEAVGATRLWNEPPYLQGQGITVAVVDSGIKGTHPDLHGAITDSRGFNSNSTNASDGFGHGTHVAGVLRGTGAGSNGRFIGTAPAVNLINVKVSDDQGFATMSDVVAGLEWILLKQDENNIRIVNISLNSTVEESYHTSPLNAALEVLWFNGIVVVVSAGNNGGDGAIYPPANDPFVITVGAVDDQGSAATEDDTLASFSAFGMTVDGISKPDIVAPGTAIVSVLASTNSRFANEHPDRVVDGSSNRDRYFRMSGTSTSAPIVAGAVALLLQDEPALTPDQVKYRLMATARPFPQGNGAGYLDAHAAVHATTTASANTGVPASQLLWTGSDPVSWGSVNWGSVNWGSVNWGSVNWGSVNWGSVNWGSTYWDE